MTGETPFAPGMRRRWRRGLIGALAAVTAAALLGPIANSTATVDFRGLVGVTSTSVAANGTCGPVDRDPIHPEPESPMLVTKDCVDPRYGQPQVEAVAVVPEPVPHVMVHVRFIGTPATAGFYYPLEGASDFEYQERFIQGPVHQLRLTGEVASEAEISFAAANGAYVVQSNPNQDYALTASDALSGNWDPSWGGYRIPAAAAKFSEEIAQQVYGYAHDPVGLYYGGSGGGYLSVTAAEMTTGVWDGVVPFVMGTPNSIPTVFTVRLHALRVLRERDKWPCVMDAIDPGGSGDPHTTCELNADEAAALQEATRAGFDPRAWYAHASMTGGPLSLVALYPPIMDPTYLDDFWSKPGYLGTEQSTAGDSVRAARVNHPTTVLAASPGVPTPPYDATGPAYNVYMISGYLTGPPRAVTLESLPEGNLIGETDLCMETGEAAGRCLTIGQVDRTTNTITFSGGMPNDVASKIQPGDQVRVDNGMHLALQTYGRHQVVPPELGGMGGTTHGWDQYRNADGMPTYPQRSVLTGPRGAYAASGSISTGDIKAKVIVAGSVMDIDAFPWQSAWYHQKVVERLTARGDDPDDWFRIWFTDHAQHGGGGGESTRTVSYQGTLQQALASLFEWIQEGTAPVPSNDYDLVEGLVKVKVIAADRGGVQPVVGLKVNGGVRADVQVGEPVTFTGTITVPPGAGKVVAAEWNAVGDAWQAADCAACDGTNDTVTIEATFTYAAPGTYFPTLRGTSQKDPSGAYGQIQNLGRARVVVTG